MSDQQTYKFEMKYTNGRVAVEELTRGEIRLLLETMEPDAAFWAADEAAFLIRVELEAERQATSDDTEKPDLGPQKLRALMEEYRQLRRGAGKK